MKRIAVDIDGVLCKTMEGFLKEFNSKHNTTFNEGDIISYDFDCFKDFSSDYIMDELILFLEKNISFLDIFENSLNVLEELKKLGFDLFILTSRSLVFKEGTEKWVKKNFGVDIFSSINIYNQLGEIYRCKAEVAKELNADILIEDAPKYIENAAKLGITVFAMDKAYNRNLIYNKNIKRVNNWDEILNNFI